MRFRVLSGWVGEGGEGGSNDFPIPEGFRQLCTANSVWQPFKDMCWDALSCLKDHGAIPHHAIILLFLVRAPHSVVPPHPGIHTVHFLTSPRKIRV